MKSETSQSSAGRVLTEPAAESKERHSRLLLTARGGSRGSAHDSGSQGRAPEDDVGIPGADRNIDAAP